MHPLSVDERRKASHPEEPWLWREAWINRRIDHSHTSDGLGILGFALAWNLFFSFVIWALFFAEGESSALRWVVVPFAALGPLLLFSGIRATWLGFRQGRSSLLLKTVPQKLGQPMEASCVMANLPEGEIHTALSCTQRYGQGKRRTVLWSDHRVVPRLAVRRTAEGYSIPIAFQLPPNQRETETLGRDAEIAWIVAVGSGVGPEGIAVLGSEFPIPVFGREVSITLEEQEAVIRELELGPGLETQLPRDDR